MGLNTEDTSKSFSSSGSSSLLASTQPGAGPSCSQPSLGPLCPHAVETTAPLSRDATQLLPIMPFLVLLTCSAAVGIRCHLDLPLEPIHSVALPHQGLSSCPGTPTPPPAPNTQGVCSLLLPLTTSCLLSPEQPSLLTRRSGGPLRDPCLHPLDHCRAAPGSIGLGVSIPTQGPSGTPSGQRSAPGHQGPYSTAPRG